jgi:hypothetical protein
MLCVSLAEVSRGIAYPVEPFGFDLVQGELPPPLPEGKGDKLGKPAGLFEQTNRRLVCKLQ